jgi:hypothetical protein
MPGNGYSTAAFERCGLTCGVMVICGLVGLFIAAANLVLITIGENHYGSLKASQSMGLAAFRLMLVVAAFEAGARPGRLSPWTPSTARGLT